MVDAAAPVSVPRIETARLVLRAFRTDDFDAYAENLADPVATEHLSGPVDRRAAWRTFAAGAGFWMLQGAGWWAVERKETAEVVGTVGAFFRERSTELEIGWSFYRRFWGRGFASEASAAALAYGLDAHRAPRAIAHIAARNVASIRVSEKLGMRYAGDVDFFGERIGRYVIER